MLVDGRDMDGNVVPWVGGDRAAAAKRRRQITDIINTQAPKELKGEKANKIYDLIGKVVEQDVKPALLPKAVMDRAPAGAIGQYNRSENHPITKRIILTVKRGLRALDPLSDDPDLANMERFRPPGVTANGAAIFDATAIIPGKFGMTPLAKANWPLGEPTIDTALAQVERREAAQAPPTNGNGHVKAAKPAKRTRNVNPEARAAAKQRMEAFWAKKRAAAQESETQAMTKETADATQ
jgi:hypothetical protein